MREQDLGHRYVSLSTHQLPAFLTDNLTKQNKLAQPVRIKCLRFPSHRDNSCLSDPRNGKKGKVSNPCEIKRSLLLEHLSALERLKLAEREHKEILKAGIGDGLVLRSAQRIEEIKSLCRAARVEYTEHCRAHRC